MASPKFKNKSKTKSTNSIKKEDLKSLEFLYEYDLDRGTRTIYFNGDIDDLLVDRTIKSMIYLDQISHEEITLKICSDGGLTDLMFALYDVIRSIRSPVRTIGTGSICSAAVLLLACGDVRQVTKHAWLMSHKAELGQASGDADVVLSRALIFKKYEQKRYELIAKHTKWTAKQWLSNERNAGEVWMEPKDMLKVGIIDNIIIPKPKPKIKK